MLLANGQAMVWTSLNYYQLIVNSWHHYKLILLNVKAYLNNGNHHDQLGLTVHHLTVGRPHGAPGNWAAPAFDSAWGLPAPWQENMPTGPASWVRTINNHILVGVLNFFSYSKMICWLTCAYFGSEPIPTVQWVMTEQLGLPGDPRLWTHPSSLALWVVSCCSFGMWTGTGVLVKDENQVRQSKRFVRNLRSCGSWRRCHRWFQEHRKSSEKDGTLDVAVGSPIQDHDFSREAVNKLRDKSCWKFSWGILKLRVQPLSLDFQLIDDMGVGSPVICAPTLLFTIQLGFIPQCFKKWLIAKWQVGEYQPRCSKLL